MQSLLIFFEKKKEKHQENILVASLYSEMNEKMAADVGRPPVVDQQTL